jgi:hypothetical protein
MKRPKPVFNSSTNPLGTSRSRKTTDGSTFSCDTGYEVPLSQRRSSMDLYLMSWDQMTLKIEGVVYGGMSGEESLRCSWILETDPRSFSSSDRLMRVLGAIV